MGPDPITADDRVACTAWTSPCSSGSCVSPLWPAGRHRFVFQFVGAVEVRRLGGELGRARIHHLEDGPNAPFLALCPHLFGQAVGQGAEVRVGEPEALCLPEQGRSQVLGQQAPLHPVDALQAAEKPAVNRRVLRQFVYADLAAQGRHECPEPQVVRLLDMTPDVRHARIVAISRRTVLLPFRCFPEQGASAHFERAYRFLDGRLEGAVYCHHLAGGLHLRAEHPVAAGELVERPTRNLDHDVVQRRLEGGRRLTSDGIGYLVECFADRDFSRYPCNRYTPVALEASAEERETRGLTSITLYANAWGFSAN